MRNNEKHERRDPEVKERALALMRAAPNISALAKSLGIPRRTLYSWRDKYLTEKGFRNSPPITQEQKLELKIRHLKEALAEKTLDLDFFKGALQRIEERRRSSSAAVESVSTNKFEP